MKIADKILERQDRDGMLRRSLERIIQLYTDKSHFVYELLQNAEDAGAGSIRFVQYKDRLEVMHDGHPFTMDNLQGLCDIGKSDKVDDLNQIGEFGVGFKSVFGICETVRLYSKPAESDIKEGCRPFSVEIRDFTKPIDIEPIDIEHGYTTLFVFPYAVGFTFSGFKGVNELSKTLAKRLKDLGVTTLLFMRNLELIEYEIRVPGYEASGAYMLDKRTVNDHCTLVSAIESEDKKEEESLSFLKFTRPIDTAVSRRTVDVAFPVKIGTDGIYEFQKAKSPFISVYFPTETESKLPFIVQGPYRTTPNRSSVPANEDENIELAYITARLLCDSIIELRDRKLLDLSFLNILPLDDEVFYSYPLFKPLYDCVKELLGKEALLPGKNGEYVKASEALIARSKDLADIFDDDLITTLINDGISYHWLPVSLTETGSHKALYSYFSSELNIEILRPEDLRRYFNENLTFLTERDNLWLIKMYQMYEGIPNIFSEKGRNILDAKIVKTSDGIFVAPYRKNERAYLPNVFLPSKRIKDAEIYTVDVTIFEACRSFFEKVLHLQAPNEYEYFVKSLKKRYSTMGSITEEQHISDLNNIVRYLRNEDYSEDMSNIMKDSFRLRCRQNGELVEVTPFSARILFPRTTANLDLEAYFRNVAEDIYFVDYEFYTSRGILHDDLQMLGISENILTGESTTSGEYYSGNPGKRPEWHTIGKFRWKLSIEKLSEVLVYISRHPDDVNSMVKSQVIFRTLMDNSDKLVGTVYIGGSTVPNKYDEPATVIKELRNEQHHYYYLGHADHWDGKWLYTESNELVAQKDISKRDLNTALYGRVSLDSPLYDILGFKKNQIDQMEDKVKEYDQLPPEKKDSYFEIALYQKYGISVEDLDRTFGTDFALQTDDEPFEFPSGNIKNWDALKKHAAQILSYANPVKYEYVVHHIRVSRPEDDIRAYLMNMYRVDSSYQYACQLCHTPHTNMVMCQLEDKPDIELDPLNVYLCPECARKFQALRRNSHIETTLLADITSLTDSEITDSNPVKIELGSESLWFTQTHIAEIRELLRLKQEAEKKRKNVDMGVLMTKPQHEIQNKKSTVPQPVVKAETSIPIAPQKQEKIKSARNVYEEYVGKRIYHRGKKDYGKVISCDETFLTIQFEHGDKAGQSVKYDLAMCVKNQWLQVVD